MLNKKKVKEYLQEAQFHANMYSGCKKVTVGCIILPHNTKTYIFGSNRAIPDLCKCKGGECRRVQLYGDDSKEHRLPSDCRALHSEIDAITQAARFGLSVRYGKMFVTRYPCEACARAIVASGISEVYYGREQEISEETAAIFAEGKVKVYHISDWTYEDTRR